MNLNEAKEQILKLLDDVCEHIYVDNNYSITLEGRRVAIEYMTYIKYGVGISFNQICEYADNALLNVFDYDELQKFSQVLNRIKEEYNPNQTQGCSSENQHLAPPSLPSLISQEPDDEDPLSQLKFLAQRVHNRYVNMSAFKIRVPELYVRVLDEEDFDEAWIKTAQMIGLIRIGRERIEFAEELDAIAEEFGSDKKYREERNAFPDLNIAQQGARAQQTELSAQQELSGFSANFWLKAAGFMMVSGGIAAIIIAFTALNLLTLGTAAIATMAVGAACTLIGIGLFSFSVRSAHNEEVDLDQRPCL